jgi:G3E family GTPase
MICGITRPSLPGVPLTPSPDPRLRLTLLGGYLGAGKTTWLRHHIHGSATPPWVIVNEASDTPVDDLLLQAAAGVSLVSGGCACCTALPALLATLRQLCDQRPNLPSDIILETSGLADPAPIIMALRADPMLAHHILLAETIVAIDGQHAIAHLQRDPLCRQQIIAADRLLLTKADLSPDPALIATLVHLNPGAVMMGLAFGLPYPLPTATAPVCLGPANGPPVQALTIALDQPMDWPAFSLWLSALLHAHGDRVLRVKGVIRTPAGRLLLQTVRHAVAAPEVMPDIPDDARDDHLAILGTGLDLDAFIRSLRQFGRKP